MDAVITLLCILTGTYIGNCFGNLIYETWKLLHIKKAIEETKAQKENK